MSDENDKVLEEIVIRRHQRKRSSSISSDDSAEFMDFQDQKGKRQKNTMSDDSDQEVVGRQVRKAKKQKRIEDSDSSSDSSEEVGRKRKKVHKVHSDSEVNASESDSPIAKPTSKKKTPRIVSDEGSGQDSEVSEWEEYFEEVDENFESLDGSEVSEEESGSSSGSDFESWDEESYEEDSISSQPAGASANSARTEKKDGAGADLATTSSVAYLSDSSDGESEKCPICLRSFNKQEIGTPEACDHSFCVDCLIEWSKNVNTCPVDRQVFTLILVRRCLQGKVVRRIPIEPPRQQEEDEQLEDPTFCEVCGDCDREDRMLLCDGCDLGYHLECLDPPMHTVPLEEWFCPDCTTSNTNPLAEEVDIQDGELFDLLEDAYAVNIPVRPRVSRLLPRTRQSERVRATVMTRQRQRAAHTTRNPAQPSTSSGIDSLEADSNASVTSTRRSRTTTTTTTTRTVRKRRKTVRRKTTKRKKRRKTTKKTSSTTSAKTGAKTGSKTGSKKTRKRRRKVRRKKRKITRRVVRRPFRIPPPTSVKGRLAEHLGVCPPRRPGQTIPDVRPRVASSRIDFQRSRAGIPTLHLFGQRDQLDYFSSGSDNDGTGYGEETSGGTVGVAIARPNFSNVHRLKKRTILSVRPSISDIHPTPNSNTCDLVGSILDSQTVWHSKKSKVTINRDGSLFIKSDGISGTPKKNSDEKSGDKSEENKRTEEGVTLRTDDRLSQISNSSAPVNVSEAGSSASERITQAPMFPGGRGGSGGARPPPGGNFQQFGGNRYSSNPSYHSYSGGSGGRGFASFPSPSSFDSRGTRAGYANYLNSGPPPPPPFRGVPPLRFRMQHRFPLRRPLAPLIRPQLHQQPLEPPPCPLEDFQTEDIGQDPQKATSQPEDEEEEVDIYSDIEVGGGSGAPCGGGSEPDDGDRSMEYEALPPPPIPPAMLMGMSGDAMSDEEPGSDSELVIDDNITAASPQENSDKYDPEAALNKEDEVSESEKYDPADPSNDTDDEDDSCSASGVKVAKANEQLGISIHIPPETTSMSNSNSNASYLHSPTYGDNSLLSSDGKNLPGIFPQVSNKFKDKDSSSTGGREIRPMLPPDDEDDEEEEDECCPNFSIYSATSMDIARRTGEDDIPESGSMKGNADSLIKKSSEASPVDIRDEDKDENSNFNITEEPIQKDDSEDEIESPVAEDKDTNLHIDVDQDILDHPDSEEGELPKKIVGDNEVDEEEHEDEIIHKNDKVKCTSDNKVKHTSDDEMKDISDDEIKDISDDEIKHTHDDEVKSKDDVEIHKDKKEKIQHKDDDDDDDDEGKDSEADKIIVRDQRDEAEKESEEKLDEEQEAAERLKKISLVEEIFGSDDDSLIGGATSAVSAATVDNVPQANVTPLGLEGLDTETISETEEAINFEDELSQDDGFSTAEEDGEIPSVKRKKKKNRKASLGGSAGDEAVLAKDSMPPEPIDYEEGEIVDDKPKQHEAVKRDKKSSEKKDKSKYDKDAQRGADENVDITGKSKPSSEEEKKKKKKKSSVDKSRASKERTVLSSSENRDKGREKSSKADDANIAWKKLSKSSKERNYRDTKGKPDGDTAKSKDVGKKKDVSSKEPAKKEKKKKEKRKDMERYDVRKIVTDKKRKRRDAFGRDLSRDRSISRSRSRSAGGRRSFERSRGRSRSPSRTRVRSRGRSPVKTRVRSRSRSRVRSRSRSRVRSRSRSKTRAKVKSKERTRKSRSKEKQRTRVSRSRSRARRSRTRTRSRSRNRSRIRTRSRSPVRSRDRRREPQKCRYRERRSWSHSWTPSWSRSRSVSCSSYSQSRTPTPRHFNHSYSRSFSRSWSREKHERIPVIEKKTPKAPKKLTVIVPNTKDDSERHRKKEKKRKEGKKNKETIALEKRKKRKERSPAPSKEVFTSGDNILVSVNFKSNKSTTNKDLSSANLSMISKESSKRKQHDGTFELEREPSKKARKDKANKEKGSPRQKNGVGGEKVILRSGEKKSKKGSQKAAVKASRTTQVVNKKPVAIIDLDQSPFHEQTPSPTALIVLSDSDEERLNKENGRVEESLNTHRMMRPTSSSPKVSSKQSISTVPSSAVAHTPESQSPPMTVVNSYLVTSTGPKTPPEPQIKFSITTKPQLRSINNPLREDEEDLLAEDAGLDDLDQNIEEELDRGLDRGMGELMHKGPNTPPEPRGPTTPCSPPTSPDAYDPFEPTKSGTPSPVGAGTSMDGLPSPVHTPSEQLIQHTAIGESPMVSDLDELAAKSLEVRVTTPTMPSAEEVADQSSQSPSRVKLSVRGDNTVASSPSIIPETTSLPPPVSSDNEMSQSAEVAEASEKLKQISLAIPTSVATSDPGAAPSPDRGIPVVIASQPQSTQATPLKTLFPTPSVKQVVQQQPITSTPTHTAAPTPVFPTLTPASIASILCTPPTSLPLSRMALFNPPSLPQLLQQQTSTRMSSPVVQQRPPLSTARATPEKLATPTAKLTPIRTNTVQNGEQTHSTQKQPPDTSTDVVDMDLESPYSPGSSEGDDLFEPPADPKPSNGSFNALGNRTVPGSNKNANKLPLPLVAMLHKSPSKPPGSQDKFDNLFGLSPLRLNKTAPARTSGKASKSHHKTSKSKGKHERKGGKKEIAIKMDEDQLQILDELPSSAVELQVKDKFLKKLNRQERVVEEVKLSLKPHYTKKHITKEEYKEILRRSVPKICHNRSGEINPIKISSLVEAYVKKYRYAAKKKAGTSTGASGKTTKVAKTTMWS